MRFTHPRLISHKTFDVLVFAFCVFAFLFLYGNFLSDRYALAPWGDTIDLTGPLFCEISRNIKAGASPIMNWSTLEALDNNTHVATYYPFYFFGWLSFCDASAVTQASDIISVFHLAVFFVTMARLIRAAGLPASEAYLSALLAVSLCNFFQIGQFPTIIAATAWLPLAIEGLVRILYRRQFLLGALVCAVGTAAMLTAGPGTLVLAAVTFSGLVLTLHASAHVARRRDWPAGSKIAGALAVAAVAIAILSIGSTIKLYVHLEEIIRWLRKAIVIGSSQISDPTEILAEQLGWRDLHQLFAPAPVNYAVGYFFWGLLQRYSPCSAQ